MRQSEVSWVIFGDGSNPKYPWGFTCLRCGIHQPIPKSVPVPKFVKISKLFLEIHKDCESVE